MTNIIYTTQVIKASIKNISKMMTNQPVLFKRINE